LGHNSHDFYKIQHYLCLFIYPTSYYVAGIYHIINCLVENIIMLMLVLCTIWQAVEATSCFVQISFVSPLLVFVIDKSAGYSTIH
ncbi:hypothetical protein ACJX0J_036819, partial [Zea mays]